jgi:ATP/maltotriose-dependent transcriptional regulator MalT
VVDQPGRYAPEIMRERPCASDYRDQHGLTRDECAVVLLWARGSADLCEIEGALGCTRTIAKKHKAHIYRKLGVTREANAIWQAACLGILDPATEGPT